MRFALLFVASVLYGQSPQGLVFVQAGALGCGAVMRDVDRIQTYCYAPDKVTLVHNTIDTVYTQLEVYFQWCVSPPAGTPACTYTSIGWWFRLLPSGGIGYQYSVNSGQIVAGTFTGIYGGPLCGLPLKLPWTGVATNWDGDQVPAMLYTAGAQQCRNWWVRDTVSGGWIQQNECGPTLVNTFTLCGG